MVDHRRTSLLFSSLLCLLLSLDFVLVVTAKSRTRFDERLTLLRLRSTLGLRGTDWPIKRDPCLAWRGIQCDPNGTVVVGINISGFKRRRIGRLNPSFSSLDPLANLTRLLYFNASGFALPGSIPDWFGVTTSLRVLDLSSCSVTGVVPVTLGNLTGLITLNLSRNRLTGSVPSSLGGLSSLSEIDLSTNSLTGPLPESFASLLNLTALDVSANYLTGPIPIGVGLLTKLIYLNLSSNSFSSLIPPEIGELVNLVDLDLSVNSLSGSVPEEFKRLTNLEKLVIGDNLLSGALPGGLFGGDNNSKLQSLVLRENGFSGDLPDACWLLPMLMNLDVAENNFTGMLPNSTSSGFNRVFDGVVVVVDVSSNMFYGELTGILARFGVMDLSGNYFEGEVPDYVVRANASLTKNCLRNEKRQKSEEDCSLFYTAKGLEFDDFGRPNTTQPEKASTRISHRTVIILAAVGGGIGFILIFILLLVLVPLWIPRRRRSRGVDNDRPTKPATKASQPPKGGGAQTFDLSRLGNAFAFEQLLQATEEFSDANLIKHGHSGSLFRGFLDDGTPVVIKKIDMKESKNEGYVSELEVFSKAGHQRLVPFLGHCLENESQKLLVYKYMRNGDLASSLFRKSENEGGDGLKSLDWITRLKIALGAAEGLAYLHHECSPPLVHRDVQASSILLDDKFEVRLGSLSEVYAQADVYQSRISRLLRLPQSTEASSSGAANATCAYDVYCFGKVLLELVTGKLGISSPDNAEAKAHMEEALKYISTNEKELVTKILDPSLLVDEDLLEEVWAMAIIAKSCLNPKPTRRPLMRHIVNALENPLKVVREDNNSGSGGSSRLRTNSSRGSWNAAIFGSWRQSASDVTGVQAGGGGNGNSGSQGSSGRRNNNNGNSSSRRRQSSEIVPEPGGYGEDV